MCTRHDGTLSCVTVTAVVLKVTSHPASHNVPMEMRECDLRSGTMCAMRVAWGSCGIGSSVVWVDIIIVPLGLQIVIKLIATCLLWTGKSTVRKLSVLPVLAMAMQKDKGGPEFGSSVFDL